MGDYKETLGEQFAKASNLKELMDTVNVMQSSTSLFEDWKNLFTIERDSEIKDQTINLIKDENSLIGWTASNVFRECNLNDENQKHLRIIFDSSDADDPKQNTRRWRIVHPLGRFPSEENKELLFTALENDPYHWVKYGAARALVEMAAITESEGMRKEILDRLGIMAPALKKNILDEIGKMLFYRNARGTWDGFAINLLETIKKSKDGHLHEEYWDDVLSKYKKGEWKN